MAGLRIYVRLAKENGVVFAQTFRRNSVDRDRKKAYFVMDNTDFDTAYIKVTYPLGKDYYNDGTYEGLENAKSALAAFTEADLVRDLS